MTKVLFGLSLICVCLALPSPFRAHSGSIETPEAIQDGGTGFPGSDRSGAVHLAPDATSAPMVATTYFRPFAASADSIAVSQRSITLTDVGETLKLTATVFDAAGNVLADAPLAWTVANPAVATVDQSGLVTAVGEGTTRIAITAGTVSVKVTVAVELGIIESERAALIRLYVSTGGTNWDQNTHWGSGQPLDAWHGVSTNEQGYVTALQLSSNNLDGQIPSELGNLSELAHLNLASNSLNGELPNSLGDLLRLIELDLSANAQLSGAIPLSLSRLEALDEFRYSGTGLCVPDVMALEDRLADLSVHQGTGTSCTGPADRDVLEDLYQALGGAQWTNADNWNTSSPLEQWQGVTVDAQGRIVQLDLSDRGLNGALPATLAALPYLTHLALDDNNLEGPIPPALGTMEELAHFSASRAALTGAVPSELSSLSNLEQLDLSGNDLTEAIPSGLGDLAELMELHLNANRLSGPLPSELGGLSALQTLSVADNAALSGEVSASFVNLEVLRAFYADGTGICLPAELQSWSDGLTDLSVSPCDTDAALKLSVSALTIAEGGSSTYTLSLASQPTAPVTVAITGQSGTDLSLDVTNLTFNPSGSDLWSTPQTLTVTAGQDPDAANDVVTLLHTASGGDYAGVTVSLSVTVTDDETVGTPPTVTITGVPAKINATTQFTATFTFSEAVTGFVTDDVIVTGGTKGTFSATNATTYTLAVTPTSGSNVTVTVAADAATNGLNTGPTAAVSATATWDATAPTVAITDVPARINSTAQFTAKITFSEAVTGFVTDDIMVTGGTKGTFSGPGTTYTLLVTPSGSADVVVTVAADAATDGLNTGPTSAVSETATWDATAPTIAITDVPATISSTTDFTATFTFSEDVTGFATGDVSVSGGTKGTFTATNAQSYTLVITPSGSVDVVVTVAADAATDGLNTGPASAVSATATWDAIPTVSISGLPPKINSTMPLTATFTFSEDVTGFTTQDVGIQGGTKGTFSGSGASYTLGVTPSGSADMLIIVVQDAATDAGSNTGPATAQSFESFWDVVAPTVSISNVPSKINSTRAFTARFTFSEEVTGFESGDISATGGTKEMFTADSEEIYTLAVTPTGSADVVVTVAAHAATDGINTGPVSAVSAMASWDATPRNVLTSVSTLEIAEGSSGSYTVWLSSQPSATVSMTITGTSFTDLTLDRTSLTFNPTGTTNLWSDPQTVTVTAGQDVDWNTDYATLINTASGADYGGTRATVNITTNDDDSSPSAPHAYVFQAVHSFFNTVPLVAGEAAWLRVFPTVNLTINSPPLPKAVATFYMNNQVVHTVNFASKTGPIPTEVWPQRVQQSYDAQIPASVIKPGLELVVELDPDDQVPANLGMIKRMPQSGRISLDVITVPGFEVTFVPLVTTGFTGSYDVEDIAQRLATNPGTDILLSDTRTLLPIKDISPTAHAAVTVSERGAVFLLGTVIALRALENGTGYWMGLHTKPDGARGIAERPGIASVAIPDWTIIAHEFGHNLSLRHAPCGRGIVRVDPNYPYADGLMGSWGINNNGVLDPAGTYDIMSYCIPHWISDYHFNKALDHRTSAALSKMEEPPVASKSTGPSLLLWGGMDADSRPYLEPIFVVEAAPSLPETSGPWQLVGQATDGDEMFNLTFAMPEVAHGDGASAFAFIVPLQQGQQLKAVTLSGPGGSFTIDGEHNDPMAIVIDEATGQVTGFLKDFDPSGDSRVSAISNKFGGNTQRVLFSRSIPDHGVQN